ncbi:hypothetical protein GCM10017706_05890 [Lactococcus lactis subsp. hordniae]
MNPEFGYTLPYFKVRCKFLSFTLEKMSFEIIMEIIYIAKTPILVIKKVIIRSAVNFCSKALMITHGEIKYKIIFVKSVLVVSLRKPIFFKNTPTSIKKIIIICNNKFVKNNITSLNMNSYLLNRNSFSI